MTQATTAAAIATPPGVGGIAVIRISGPRARQIAAEVFRPAGAGKKLEEQPGYRALYGRFYFRGQQLDDGLALVFRAPHSYTGEDVVELSCHGGEAVTRHLLLACLEAGAKAAGPGEFTRRAVLNGRLSLTQAEAVMEMISASSRRGIALARSGMAGALKREVEQLKDGLLELMGHIAAWTDYPEEDVPPLEREGLLQTLGNTRKKLEKWLKGYDRGTIVRRGVRTAILGSPNVGKSTLFNLLSGFERAIVNPVAGTTRDVLHEQILVAGIPLLLSDTAGLRSSEDPVEQEGIRRSRKELEAAELAVAVFDGSQALSQEDLQLAQLCKNRRALALVNKSDLGVVLEEAALLPYFSSVLTLSAFAADTRDRIEEAVAQLLGTAEIDGEETLLANARQWEMANRAFEAVAEAENAAKAGVTLDAVGVCVEDGLQALAELSGENITEQILEEVFSNFCVGK